MVLSDLSKKLTSALGQLTSASVVDDSVIDAILKELCSALLQSDVNVKLVGALRTKVKAKIKAEFEAAQNESSGSAGLRESSKKNIVQKAVYDELVALVDPGTESFQPKKGKTNIIMAVGLQGAGKTTSCTKLAVYYKMKGFRVGLVCADTFRAGAFDQLKQNAARAKIPFYGSYTESDPVRIAAEGVAMFKREKFDLALVDTSGRHRQEAELFREMEEIAAAVKPDQVIMVMDGSIGQAAESQAKAFKESSNFASILVTKLDGHAKGGGAISAAAAAKTPIAFIGTGEQFNDLEPFRPRPFVSKLLGLGDMGSLIEHMQDVANANPDKQKAMIRKMQSGRFALRDWREQLSTLINMGSLSKVMQAIPGMSGGNSEVSEQDAGAKLKRMIYIMDAMTAEELDSDGLIFIQFSKKGEPLGLNRRAVRVARGSGTTVREVEELLVQARAMSGLAKTVGGMKNMGKQDSWMKAAQQMNASGQRPSAAQIQALQKSMPPGLLQKMRAAGPAGAQKIMQEEMAKSASGRGGGLDMNAMMQAMGGADAMSQFMPPGMDMGAMQRMMGNMGGMGGLPGMGGMPDIGKLMGSMGSMFGGGK